jgi:hypothetical protein
MKKLPLFLFVSITVAAVTALILHLISDKKKSGAINVPTGAGSIPVDENSRAAKTFKGFNYNQFLNENTVNSEAELTALQHLINGYYGSQAIAVTGLWDAATASAVLDITGLSGVSLYQFRYYYFTPLRGDAAARQIFNQLTENRQ